MYNNMDIQIHHLEQEAYCSVLRAFKAQADAITWEKEGLITELRKELRVSDEEHRELLSRVNADDVIKRIREWRQGMDNQSAILNASQTMSNSRRKQNLLSSVPSMSLGMQSAPLPFHSMNTSLPPSSLDQANTPGRRRKRPKPDFSSGAPGARHIVNPSLSAHIHTDSAASNPLIRRRVMIRWPEDNNFYEAVINDYDPSLARHCLVYDQDTPNEITEWVALDEIPRENIRWVGEDPSAFIASGVGIQSHVADGDIVNGQSAQQIVPTSNGSGDKKIPEYIEIFDTNTLINEVEKVLNSSNPDPVEIQTAKRMLCVRDFFFFLDCFAKTAKCKTKHLSTSFPGARTGSCGCHCNTGSRNRCRHRQCGAAAAAAAAAIGTSPCATMNRAVASLQR